MIKLECEIIGERIKYSYEVGKSRASGETDLCPDSLNAFNLMLKMVFNHNTFRYQEWMDEARAKAYLEKHPELLSTAKQET